MKKGFWQVIPILPDVYSHVITKWQICIDKISNGTSDQWWWVPEEAWCSLQWQARCYRHCTWHGHHWQVWGRTQKQLHKLPTDHKTWPPETEWREAPVQTHEGIILWTQMVQGWIWSRSKEDQANSPDANARGWGNHEKLLGMLNFLSSFSSKLSELLVPLRNISNVRGLYQPTLQAVQCFQVIQTILGKDIKLPYFNTQKHTTLQTDASKA